jgi:hypothetical protein
MFPPKERIFRGRGDAVEAVERWTHQQGDDGGVSLATCKVEGGVTELQRGNMSPSM